MPDPAVRARLGELTRARRMRVPAEEGGWPPRPIAPARAASEPEAAAVPRSEHVGVEAFLPGGEWHGPQGAVFVHETLRSQVERRHGHWRRLEAVPVHTDRVVPPARARPSHTPVLRPHS